MQALCESRIAAQAVPLRRDGEVNEAWIVAFDGEIELPERFVQVSRLPKEQGELDGREALNRRLLNRVADHPWTSTG